eukprot:scaffold95359_cov55-Phaeocystis_antarctica.AAC.3
MDTREAPRPIASRTHGRGLSCQPHAWPRLELAALWGLSWRLAGLTARGQAAAAVCVRALRASALSRDQPSVLRQAAHTHTHTDTV